jgi:hypothetical protein
MKPMSVLLLLGFVILNIYTLTTALQEGSYFKVILAGASLAGFLFLLLSVLRKGKIGGIDQ